MISHMINLEININNQKHKTIFLNKNKIILGEKKMLCGIFL